MQSSKVLVVAAHPDDEIIGCGGTMAKHVRNKDEVNVLFLADGESSRFNKNIKSRRKMAESANKIIGTKSLKFLNLRDNQLDSYTLLKIIKKVEDCINKVKPDIIYTHYVNDLNIDHRITNQAVLTASRPFQNATVKKILTFEILSSTGWNSHQFNNFIPNYHEDISKFLDIKIKSLKCYNNEILNNNEARSYRGVKALSEIRGCMVGLKNAEAFLVERIISK